MAPRLAEHPCQLLASEKCIAVQFWADHAHQSCGWGSLCLYLAEIFPSSRITAFSNSSTQKKHIDSCAVSKNLKNLNVITGDIAAPISETNFPPKEAYDRVLSIELFEHMKNYELLMRKIAHGLRSGGKLFLHYFSHKDTPYDFEGGWMTEHFFTGGTMPSADLLLFFQGELRCKEMWWVSGRHYAQTCEVSISNLRIMSRQVKNSELLPWLRSEADERKTQDWLLKLTANKNEAWPGLAATYGKDKALMWFHRWQIFYMACAELFAWEGGDTWGVTHYLFEKAAHTMRSEEKAA